MDTDTRRNNISRTIKNARAPISASALAQRFNVSRQIIVGDIALLRAEGADILATPKGYIMGTNEMADYGFIATIACKHHSDRLQEEMYTIVDYGATIIDVTVEHSVYGQLSGQLNISSRFDVDEFCEKIFRDKVKPLSDLTDGTHLHRIGCNSKDIFERISNALKEKGLTL